MTRRQQALDELDRDIRDHIQQEIEENLNRGMNADEARHAALRAFGNITIIKEDARAVWIPVWLDQAVQDLRYALRVFGRAPAFTMLVVGILAVGIGVNAAVFAVTNAVLFKGFSLVKDSDRIVYIDSPKNGNGCCLSYADFEDWRAQAKSFTEMAAARGIAVVIGSENHVATQVTANFFKLAGQNPIRGRDFEAADETPGAPPVAILNYGFWESQYGKNPAIVGRTIRIDGVPTVVIGVMPKGLAFPQKQDLWLPLVQTPEGREARSIWVAAARLADGVSLQSARAEMQEIGKRLATAYPLTDSGVTPVVHNFQEFFIGPDATMIYICLWAAAGFVLLIACANVANLLLARSIGRSREISIRIALGAGRGRIVRQLLIESAMLATFGGLLGLAFAKCALQIYQLAEWPPGARVWRVLDYSLDFRVFVYVAAISIGAALLAGLAPAVRLAKWDVNAVLKGASHGSARRTRLSGPLIAGEIALAMVVLAAAGLMTRSFLNIYTAGVGVKAANVVTASIALPASRYSTPETRISFYGRLTTSLAAIPGVESIALADRLPADGSSRFPFEIPGLAEDGDSASALIVSDGYFRTLGATLLAGRDFTHFDGGSGAPVAIVNQRFAAEYWPNENPVGQHLRLLVGRTPQPWLTVIGVASNIVQDYSRQRIDPLLYLPYAQNPAPGMNVLVRTRVPLATIAPAMRREIQALDADLPVLGPSTLAARLRWSYWEAGFYGALFLTSAAIALLLATIGLYAVVAHSVSQRTQEIGIRMALGATRLDVLRIVLLQAMLPAGIGLIAGLGASLATARILKTILVSVSPADSTTYLLATAVLIVSAALGCWIPARRAMRVDPAVAVRHE